MISLESSQLGSHIGLCKPIRFANTYTPSRKNGVTPDTDTESSLPTVGVDAALRELVEEMEEVLSARASGAKGGGLDEWVGGLKGRFCLGRKGKRFRKEETYQCWCYQYCVFS